ncbi:MAG: hypothetical protein JWM98_3 [Thermoleophilia bacterium]|nr:hypothetical protein [Thermoleophilia bacterium]
MADAATRTGDGAPVASRRVSTPVAILGAVLVAIALVGIAVWLVGPKPRSADSGLPKSPPPLALPDGTPTTAPLARAAASLAKGDLDVAHSAFEDIVAQQPDSVPGQVGLALSRWSRTGPRSSEADLRQLALEEPDSAYVALHLGLVQALLDEPRQARASLHDALSLGRATHDATQLHMASLADDLLHPRTFRGSMPVFIQATEVRAEHRAQLERLLTAIAAEDRSEAARIAASIGSSDDAMLRVAGVAATFSKDDIGGSVKELDTLASDARLPKPARDRAALQATMAQLWSGTDRTASCVRLHTLAGAATDPGTRRLAAPIEHEVCAKDSATPA